MQQENAAVSPDVAQKAQAVENALVQLGADADPKRLAEVVKTQTGLDMDPGEVAAIRAGLASQEPPQDTQQPPGPPRPFEVRPCETPLAVKSPAQGVAE